MTAPLHDIRLKSPVPTESGREVGLAPSNRALAQANADLREQIARAEGTPKPRNPLHFDSIEG